MQQIYYGQFPVGCQGKTAIQSIHSTVAAYPGISKNVQS